MFNRKVNRLQSYNYSTEGYYFVTVCVESRLCCLGEIVKEEMVLNEFGKIVNSCWQDLSNHYKNCSLDQFIIMPNHIHGIIVVAPVGEGLKPSPTRVHGLSEIVRGFKTFSSRKINQLNQIHFSWQRSFYDHVIRKDESLNNIRQYILSNPYKWAVDKENPSNWTY